MLELLLTKLNSSPKRKSPHNQTGYEDFWVRVIFFARFVNKLNQVKLFRLLIEIQIACKNSADTSTS